MTPDEMWTALETVTVSSWLSKEYIRHYLVNINAPDRADARAKRRDEVDAFLAELVALPGGGA